MNKDTDKEKKKDRDKERDKNEDQCFEAPKTQKGTQKLCLRMEHASLVAREAHPPKKPGIIEKIAFKDLFKSVAPVPCRARLCRSGWGTRNSFC